MDEAGLRGWIEAHHLPAVRSRWEADDLEGFADLRTSDVVQVSFRSLSDGYAEGRKAAEEFWTVRPFFPALRIRLDEVKPPDRCLVTSVLGDGEGNEVHVCTAIQYLDGLARRELIYDLDEFATARAALSDIEAICTRAKRRYAAEG